jgi:hypothetical protein
MIRHFSDWNKLPELLKANLTYHHCRFFDHDSEMLAHEPVVDEEFDELLRERHVEIATLIVNDSCEFHEALKVLSCNAHETEATIEGITDNERELVRGKSLKCFIVPKGCKFDSINTPARIKGRDGSFVAYTKEKGQFKRSDVSNSGTGECSPKINLHFDQLSVT